MSDPTPRAAGAERTARTERRATSVELPPRLDDVPALPEAFVELRKLARGDFGAIPPEVVAAHVIEVTAGADWTVQRAALEALARRFAAIERDGLMLKLRAAQPSLGPVVVKRPRSRHAQEYTTTLRSVWPLAGSCDCADFVRSSLGLCKHLLCGLDALHSRPAALLAALRKRGADAGRARLDWDFVRPLDDAGDPFDRLLLSTTAVEEFPELQRRFSKTVAAPPPRPAGIDYEVSVGIARALAPKRRAPLVETWLVEHVASAPSPLRVGLRLVPVANRSTRTRDAVIAELLAACDAGLHVEPAALALLDDASIDSTRERRGERFGKGALPLEGLRRKLYPYQLDGVRRVLTNGRLLLADDMGLGKTTQAIASCHALFNAKRVTKALLIVPAALKPQWVREWQDTSPLPIVSVDGSPADRAEIFRRGERGAYVIGYEQLLRDWEEVQRFAPELVVLDEAQRIKNYATKSAVYVKALQPEYRLVLTGTPLENRLAELASIVEWVDDHALEPKWRLEPAHLTPSDANERRGASGARRLDTLRARLAPVMLRRVRTEVLSQLPARTDTRIPVPVTPEQLARHDELSIPIAQLLQVAQRRPLTPAQFLRLVSLLTQQRIIANGLAQLHFESVWPTCASVRPTDAVLDGLFAPKLGVFQSLVRDLLEQGRKIVVFSQWLRMLKLAWWSVGDVLAERGQRAVFFTGNESPKARTRSVVEFHDDPSATVMFLSDAGGVGLNLQRAASACINLELPWNPAVLEQRIGRIYRLGQKLPIDVYNLVSEDCIESRIARIVAGKHALFKGLFDGDSNEITFEDRAGFLAAVERVVGDLPKLPDAADTDADALDASAEALPALSDALPSEAPPSDAAPTAPALVDTAPNEATAAEASDALHHRTATHALRDAPAESSALLQSLRVAWTAEGGLLVDAPPEIAPKLAELLSAMAEQLRARTTSLDAPDPSA
jgi:hypothetical protein